MKGELRRRLEVAIVGLAALILVSLGLAGCFQLVNAPPVARFTTVPSSGPAPLTVACDASGSSDVDGTIVLYLWNFGDTQTASGVLVSHVYTQTPSQVYTVVLTVTDNDAATDTVAKFISVTP